MKQSNLLIRQKARRLWGEQWRQIALIALATQLFLAPWLFLPVHGQVGSLLRGAITLLFVPITETGVCWAMLCMWRGTASGARRIFQFVWPISRSLKTWALKLASVFLLGLLIMVGLSVAGHAVGLLAEIHIVPDVIPFVLTAAVAVAIGLGALYLAARLSMLFFTLIRSPEDSVSKIWNDSLRATRGNEQRIVGMLAAIGWPAVLIIAGSVIALLRMPEDPAVARTLVQVATEVILFTYGCFIRLNMAGLSEELIKNDRK